MHIKHKINDHVRVETLKSDTHAQYLLYQRSE